MVPFDPTATSWLQTPTICRPASILLPPSVLFALFSPFQPMGSFQNLQIYYYLSLITFQWLPDALHPRFSKWSPTSLPCHCLGCDSTPYFLRSIDHWWGQRQWNTDPILGGFSVWRGIRGCQSSITGSSHGVSRTRPWFQSSFLSFTFIPSNWNWQFQSRVRSRLQMQNQRLCRASSSGFQGSVGEVPGMLLGQKCRRAGAGQRPPLPVLSPVCVSLLLSN